MPWFRLDEGFHSHLKVLQAGNEAVGFFVRCCTYAAEKLTDGFVPAEIVNLYGSPDLAEKLVSTGLFHPVEGGWQIHDFLDYNPSRSDVLLTRQQHADRQKRYIARAKGSRVTDASATPSLRAPRPDPSRKDGSGLRPSPSLPAHAAFARGGNAAPARPEWCGYCDRRTRLFEIDGRAVRCARCHPMTQEGTPQ